MVFVDILTFIFSSCYLQFRSLETKSGWLFVGCRGGGEVGEETGLLSVSFVVSKMQDVTAAVFSGLNEPMGRGAQHRMGSNNYFAS